MRHHRRATPLAGGRPKAHIERMAAQSPPPYGIKTRRCTIHAGRYRWDILAGGKAVQSSMDSFATRHEAEVAGRAEMEKFIGARPRDKTEKPR
jgi:hypothetical protein